MSLRSSYLRRRPNGFLFRRAIPGDLQPRFGCTEVIRSLMRIGRAEAKVTAQYLWVATEALFRVVRQMPELSAADIKIIQAHYLDELRRRAFEDHYEEFSRAFKAGTTETWLETSSKFTSQMAAGLLRDADRQARRLEPETVIAEAKKAGYSIEPETFDEHRVQKALLEAQAVFKFAEARHLVEWRDEHELACSSVFSKAVRALSGRHQLASQEGLEALLNGTPRMKNHPLLYSGLDVYPPRHPEPVKPIAVESAAPESPVQETAAAAPPLAAPQAQDDIQPVAIPEAADAVVGAIAKDAPAELVAPPRAAGSAPHPDVRNEERLISQVWKEWLSHEEAERDGKNSRRSELQASSNSFTWLAGDLPIENYERSHFRDFKLKFLKLPVDYKNMRYVRKDNVRCERSYAEVAAIADKLNLERVCAKTFNKHAGNLRKFYEWCRVEGYLPPDHPDLLAKLNIHIKKTPTEVQEERSMVPLDVIEEFFQMSIWTGRKSDYFLVAKGDKILRNAHYWVPLAISCHGMRREEICQLKVKHVKREDGIWNFDLRDPDLDLKTPNGHRQIPLSKGFIATGFPEERVIGRSDDEMLFPELNNENAHDAYGEALGKAILNYVDNLDFTLPYYRARLREELSVKYKGEELEAKIEFKVAERVQQIKKEFTLHGLRHTLSHMLRNNPAVKDSYVDELFGHAPQFNSPEARRYGKKVWLTNLKAAIDAYEPPIDFEGLRMLAEAYKASLKKKGEDAA